ncbi:hypothetical protein [Roseofilum casamattae]|uniref:Uncharacterized protein n=1 Tax=Roseofilum casamattae BLCC-M143 TaxID=3022442 RepID=A0ABT7BUT2_9CYAN|nr:hypothetical protein [Roseofilum casamattae]MDJ1182953.1 hypothetical protein [Roseofilum casamattae BLCC-M143]
MLKFIQQVIRYFFQSSKSTIEEPNVPANLEVTIKPSIPEEFDSDESNESEKNAIARPSSSLKTISLQEQIDTKSSATLTLQLSNQEYAGPITINSPLLLDGRGSTIWARQGPVVSINSENVRLSNLRIEITGNEQTENPKERYAIFIGGQHNIQLDNVEVRGEVMGVLGEEGKWNYPQSLHLGKLAYGREYDLCLRLIVPVNCTIDSDISALDLQPRHLQAGPNEIQLHVERLPADTLINGNIFLVSSSLKRRITFNASIVSSKEIREPENPIWQPEDWSSILASQSSFVEPEVTAPAIPLPVPEISSIPNKNKENQPTQTTIQPQEKVAEIQRKIGRGERPNETLFSPNVAIHSDRKNPISTAYSLGDAFSTPYLEANTDNNESDRQTDSSQPYQLGTAFNAPPTAKSSADEKTSSPKEKSINPLFQTPDRANGKT